MSGERHQELVARAEARVGQVIDGKWTLDKLLGVGGMAAVYAATHRNGKRGAIKILHPHEALDAGMKARFLREGYLANKVGHPGAVSILDDDEAPDGTVYLVMELLEGETADARSPLGTTMASGDVLLLASRLLDVLAAAHDKGIVHRDLKPSNLFITTDGTLKVLDFGIARLHERSGDGKPQGTTVSAMGTPGFMPPEQARGRWEEVDARADIWAVGATMFTLLTGKGLHEEGTLNEQLLAAMSKPCPPIATVSPSVSPAIAEIVDRALAFDKTNRWPDARSMRAAVDAAYQTVTGRPMSMSTHVILTPTMPRDSGAHDPQLASATTLAAPSNPVLPVVEQRNTSSPVASSGAMWAPMAGGRRWALVAGAAVVTVIAVLVGVGLRAPHQSVSAASSVPSSDPPPVVSASPSSSPPEEHSVAVPETVASVTPTTTAPAVHVSHAGAKPRASASAAASSEVVDIFTRRK